MSTVSVKFQLTDAAKRAELIATGNQPKQDQEVILDLAQLSPAQRTAIADFSPSLSAIEIRAISDSGSNYSPLTRTWLKFDGTPTADEIIAHCARMAAEEKAATASIHTRALAQGTEKIADYIEKANTALLHSDFSAWLDDCNEAKNCSNYAKYMAIRAEVQSLQPAWKATNEAKKAARQAEAEAKAEAERQARLVWAQQFGSERLRRGMEANHACERLYWIERTAQDYPGCVLDYEKSGDSSARVCPTIAELNARDAMLAVHPQAAVEIMWLTDEPHDTKASSDDYYEPFEQCAALEINDPDYPRMIYQLL